MSENSSDISKAIVGLVIIIAFASAIFLGIKKVRENQKKLEDGTGTKIDELLNTSFE